MPLVSLADAQAYATQHNGYFLLTYSPFHAQGRMSTQVHHKRVHVHAQSPVPGGKRQRSGSPEPEGEAKRIMTLPIRSLGQGMSGIHKRGGVQGSVYFPMARSLRSL